MWLEPSQFEKKITEGNATSQKSEKTRAIKALGAILVPTLRAVLKLLVVQTMDSTIHWINRINTSKTNRVIQWIVNYPEDSAINRLNNWGLMSKPGTHDPEPTILLCSCNGVFTDRFIFRLNFPRMRLP